MSGPAQLTDLTDLRVDHPADGVVQVTLDLPDRRNMMSAAMTSSWRRVMAALRDDRSVRAVVVTGAGSAFCSGGDLSWIGGEPDASVDDLRERMRAFYRDWLSVRELDVPTIAAVNGAAVGAGLAVALACDLRYASEDARMGVPFTSLGMHPGMATTWLLPEVAGLGVARELLLTGRMVSGAEAAQLGLVNRAVPA
ncbi:MAG: enoyl-CoA hydratase/isomerase family protein, partial [Actinomycetes bacterium]